MENQSPDSLKTARESLLRGMRLSTQGSYTRRAPAPDSLPFFTDARKKLEGILVDLPDHREALMMMSQIAECLLDYYAALSYLMRAFDAGEPKSKKSLKRLARLREGAHEWRDLGLPPEILRELGDHLEASGVTTDHTTLRITRDWLIENHVDNPESIIAALERRGAFSDFQVLANVCRG